VLVQLILADIVEQETISTEPMNIPETGQVEPGAEVFHPHKDLKKLWFISAGILICILLLAAIVFEMIAWGEWDYPGLIELGILLVIAVPTIALNRPIYNAITYIIRDHDVVVCEGLIWRKRVCIPRSRLQHVDIQSGPIERRFGLCHMEIHTAGTSTAAATLHGLTHEKADQLRQDLTGMTSAKSRQVNDIDTE
jgi:membrane protein YdbS with pleckstrin-like domain